MYVRIIYFTSWAKPWNGVEVYIILLLYSYCLLFCILIIWSFSFCLLLLVYIIIPGVLYLASWMTPDSLFEPISGVGILEDPTIKFDLSLPCICASFIYAENWNRQFTVKYVICTINLVWSWIGQDKKN